MRSLISTAPDDIRAELRDLNVYRLLERAAAFRPGTGRDPRSLTKLSLRLTVAYRTSLERAGHRVPWIGLVRDRTAAVGCGTFMHPD
jgi:hypothetical protein